MGAGISGKERAAAAARPAPALSRPVLLVVGIVVVIAIGLWLASFATEAICSGDSGGVY